MRYCEQNSNKRLQSLRSASCFFLSNSSFYAPANLCVCVLVSHLYGFGLLDAESLVQEAERWKRVPSQHECVEVAPVQLSRYRTNRTARLLHFESGLPF